MGRRVDRTAGEHDFAAAKLLLSAVDQRLHAHTARVLEQELLHLRIGRDRQVGALASLAIEIAHRGRDTVLGLIGMRDREIALDELTVLVGQERIAGTLAGLGYGLRMFCPVLPRDAADGDTAVFAV